MSGRLVAAIMTTPSAGSKPSISESIWLSVCSRSSWPPPSPAPRLRPIESISSTKTIAGACLRAVWNRSRTRLAPTPTNISMKSEPLTDRNGTPASPATARASSVLPVPGGPDEEDALRDLGPDLLEPGRGLQEVDDLADLLLDAVVAGHVGEGGRGRSVLYRRARERPIDMIPDIWPWAWRLIETRTPRRRGRTRIR